ncbi:Carbohydrate sulfotransferase [Sergentomyia squamirostris]
MTSNRIMWKIIKGCLLVFISYREHRSEILSPNDMRKTDEKMKDRREHAYEMCSKYKLDQRGIYSLRTRNSPNSREFFIEKKYRIVWCNVFKAASTSWLYNFNIMAGYNLQFIEESKKNPLGLARTKYPRPSVKELRSSLNDSVSFIVVRHPFERLLSAYWDKIQNPVRASMYEKLGNTILEKIRKEENLESPRPTFSEFVSYLLNEFHANHKLDNHWKPIMELCTPCQVRFDIIAKFETLDVDQIYIIEKANISNIVTPQWRNPGKKKEKAVEDFYKELSNQQIRELYEIYEYDFEIFDYSVNKFFQN